MKRGARGKSIFHQNNATHALIKVIVLYEIRIIVNDVAYSRNKPNINSDGACRYFNQFIGIIPKQAFRLRLGVSRNRDIREVLIHLTISFVDVASVMNSAWPVNHRNFPNV